MIEHEVMYILEYQNDGVWWQFTQSASLPTLEYYVQNRLVKSRPEEMADLLDNPKRLVMRQRMTTVLQIPMSKTLETILDTEKEE